MTRRTTREFTEEFKQQMVQLHLNGKPRSEIIKEYDLTASTFHEWVQQYNDSRSFKTIDNGSPKENELIKLRKINQQLKMENDILKQVALIMGRK